MIQEVKMYTVTCDNCKDVFETCNGFAAWFDESDAREIAENKYWHTEGNKHYCPDCYLHNNQNELVIDESRTDKYAPK